MLMVLYFHFEKKAVLKNSKVQCAWQAASALMILARVSTSWLRFKNFPMICNATLVKGLKA